MVSPSDDLNSSFSERQQSQRERLERIRRIQEERKKAKKASADRRQLIGSTVDGLVEGTQEMPELQPMEDESQNATSAPSSRVSQPDDNDGTLEGLLKGVKTRQPRVSSGSRSTSQGPMRRRGSLLSTATDVSGKGRKTHKSLSPRRTIRSMTGSSRSGGEGGTVVTAPVDGSSRRRKSSSKKRQEESFQQDDDVEGFQGSYGLDTESVTANGTVVTAPVAGAASGRHLGSSRRGSDSKRGSRSGSSSRSGHRSTDSSHRRDRSKSRHRESSSGRSRRKKEEETETPQDEDNEMSFSLDELVKPRPKKEKKRSSSESKYKSRKSKSEDEKPSDKSSSNPELAAQPSRSNRSATSSKRFSIRQMASRRNQVQDRESSKKEVTDPQDESRRRSRSTGAVRASRKSRREVLAAGIGGDNGDVEIKGGKSRRSKSLLAVSLHARSEDSIREMDYNVLKANFNSAGHFANNAVLVNTERTKNGLKALQRDLLLDEIAKDYVKQMADSGGSMEIATTYCGNMMRGPSIRVIHAAMMENERDKGNILNPAFQAMGVATVKGNDGNLYLCQLFGFNTVLVCSD